MTGTVVVRVVGVLKLRRQLAADARQPLLSAAFVGSLFNVRDVRADLVAPSTLGKAAAVARALSCIVACGIVDKTLPPGVRGGAAQRRARQRRLATPC